MGPAILRHMTYSGTRLLFFDTLAKVFPHQNYAVSLGAAGIAGALGALIANPLDVITVRMQDDARLPPQSRRK